MPLTTGQRLGPYEIVAAIGAGGMGEVYKAKDTRLDRTVAIKVLPAANAADPDFRARFEREARTISQLNHPHICALYDVGAGTVPAHGVGLSPSTVEYLVMEHLEGETLADRLKKGPIPVEQALEIATEMADALDKAHRLGIIHRDLKPANVMLTKSGSKLLDFGLAKMGVAPQPGTVETRLLTSPPPVGASVDPLTARGTILGTFQYMAPEQLEGKDADTRTDIWAFGCVVYEMVTGKRTFDGKTQASLIAAILEREPTPMAELLPITPPALGRLVRTCLAKDPDNRFQTAHDLGLQLQWIDEGGSAAGLPAPVIAKRKQRERTMWLAVAAVAAALAGAATWWLKPAPDVTNIVSRFRYDLPEGQSFTRTGRHIVAISPDGTKIAYVASNQLYIRPIGQLEAQPIRGTNEDPLEPVFSPDSKELAYFVPSGSSTTLKKIAVAGGAPVTLCSLESFPYGVTWKNGQIAFGQNGGKSFGILAVAETGGTPRTLASVDPAKERATQPQLLDDGTHLVFTVLSAGATGDEGQIVVQPLDGGARTVLVNGGTNGQIVATGQLLYIHNATLLAVPFDVKRLAVVGGPVPIVEGVRETSSSWAGQFSISREGTLAYAPGSYSGGERQLVWVDRQGHEQPIGAKPRAYGYPRISPDGTKLAITSSDEENDVWTWDLVKETLTRLTFGPAVELYPVWMPDSRRVVFRSSEAGRTDVFRKMADGTGTVEPLTKDGAGGEPQSISPDGKLLVLRTAQSTSASDLMILPLDGSGPPKPLLADAKFGELNGEISPDGRWIAYQSNENGVEVYVRPFPLVDNGRWQVSSGGGSWPMWSRSGRELFFVSTTSSPQRLMSVDVQPGAAFTFGRPKPLFAFTPPYTPLTGRNFDIAADGRFLMMKSSATDTSQASLFVVSHWFDELRARMGGK